MNNTLKRVTCLNACDPFKWRAGEDSLGALPCGRHARGLSDRPQEGPNFDRCQNRPVRIFLLISNSKGSHT